MNLKKITAPALGIAMCFGLSAATAQTGNPAQPSPPQTTPPATQKTQQEVIRETQVQESTQDKRGVILEQRESSPATDPARRLDPQPVQTEKGAVKQEQQVKTTADDGTRTQTRTSEVVTPSGTTITNSSTRVQTHQPGQAPDRTMIIKRTVTTAGGKTIEF